jgi:hypothetical protein
MVQTMTGRLLAAGRLAFALAAVFVVQAIFGASATAQPARSPIVVELYTSQGCFSCPRANRLLGEFSRDRDILALTFPVGYWDYLGWQDTFAQPEFVNRQRDYAREMRFRGPYTPQLIIDGVRQVSAGDWDQSRAVFEEVRALDRVEHAPEVTLTRLPGGDVRVVIGAGVRQGLTSDIWLISYDPGPLTILVTSGENVNRRVTHYNLVRRVQRLGSWSGPATWFERPRCSPECAVLVQQPRGGRIIAAAYTRRSR